jgi:hypothetical protein
MIAQPLSSNLPSNIDATAFKLEANGAMFSMLFKNVYTDTILAGIRELSTNALDACIHAGTDPAFDVHLPTIQNPTFSVRDYGTGLSEELITTMYTTMGASTKRDSNAYNGSFGIGKLAPLAYSSSFTVESFYNNTHYVYLISIKDGIPVYLKLSESPSLDLPGLKVSYAVEARDIPRFIEKATFLYSFFSTQPTTNIPLDYFEPTLSGTDWGLYPNLSGTYVLMANVPYQLNYRQLHGCVISIPTGSVSITPGREGLTYDAPTEVFISKLLETVNADIRATAVQQAASVSSSPFLQCQALLSANRTINSLNAKPADLGHSAYFRDYFQLRATPSITPIAIGRYTSKLIEPYYASRNPTHILIQDIASNFLTVALDAYKSLDLKGDQLILRPSSNTKSAIETLVACYPAYLQSIGLDHLPVVHISTYVTEATKTTSTKLASTTFQPTDIRNSKRPIIDLSTNVSTHYYFLETPDVDLITNVETLTGVTFLVLPKKVHSIISNYPLFIEATPAVIQQLLLQRTYTVVDPHVHDVHSRVYYIRSVESTRFDFQAIYDTCNNPPRDFSKSVTYIQSNSTYQLQTSTFSPPVTLDDISAAYPQLKTLLGSTYSTTASSIYISLEDQLHALRTTS